MAKKYSIEEIDQMRESISLVITPYGISYNPIELSNNIENQLRTHMQNGTTVEELKNASDRRMDAYFKRHGAI